MVLEGAYEDPTIVGNNSTNPLLNLFQELEAYPEEKASVSYIFEEASSDEYQEEVKGLRELGQVSYRQEADSDDNPKALSSFPQSESLHCAEILAFQQKTAESSEVANFEQTDIYVTPQKRKTHVTYASCLQENENELFISSFFVGISFQGGLNRIDLSREIKV